MANKKKSDVVVDAPKQEEIKEEPVVVAGVTLKELEERLPEEVSVGPVGIFVEDVPLADLKELLGLVRESYSRSNNRDFRLRCKRLEASVSEFVGLVEAAVNG